MSCGCNRNLHAGEVRVADLLQARLTAMRPAEAEVARRLCRQLHQVAKCSLRELARELDTSDATVLRTCRAAGFDGYQDLKYHVLREFTSAQVARLPSAGQHYAADLAASLQAARRSLDRAANLLRAARRVVLVGEGASCGIAIVAMDILFTLGRPAVVIANEQTAAYFLASNPRDFVLLAISHSGETQFPTRTVREARERGFKTIALTNEPASELARLAHVVLPTQVVESARGRYAIAPRICQLAVLDQLFDRLTGLRSGAKPVTRCK